MSRSIKKGPFVDDSLLKKSEAATKSGKKDAIKTWSRRSTILPEFVGQTFAVHTGTTLVNVFVPENIVGHRLGKCSATPLFRGHGHISGKSQQKSPTTQKRRLASAERRFCYSTNSCQITFHGVGERDEGEEGISPRASFEPRMHTNGHEKY